MFIFSDLRIKIFNFIYDKGNTEYFDSNLRVFWKIYQNTTALFFENTRQKKISKEKITSFEMEI